MKKVKPRGITVGMTAKQRSKWFSDLAIKTWAKRTKAEKTAIAYRLLKQRAEKRKKYDDMMLD